VKLKLAEDLALPLEAVSRTFGILAVRGAGKSNTAAVMAEEMFAAGLPFVVVDPVGSWYGLRSSADGKQAGLPIPIFGGKHGDLPLERGAGELLADLVVERRLSCVLDLSRFDSEAAKKEFLLAFARRLYLKNEDPLHLFLEEADDYIPQKPMRDEAQLLRAWENIVRRGRSRGLGMTLITQRSASINKMVLTQVETLFAMRTTGPQDIAAIEAWVKYHQVGQEVISSLASLEDGEAWVWSPHFLKAMARVQIRRRRTFDSGATPKNVKAGDRRPAATLADVDLETLRTKLAATIEKAKADDPRELRRQIAELRRQLASTGSKSPAERPHQAATVVEKPVLKDGQLARAEQLLAQFQRATDRLQAQVHDLRAFDERLGGMVLDIAGALGRARQAPAPPNVERIIPPARQPGRPAGPVSRPRTPGGRSAGEGGSLGKGERIVLTAIAQYPAGASREQLTVLTGYKRSSRDAYIQRLQAAGLVAPNGAGLVATDAGVAALGSDFEPLPTGRALAAYWLDRLGGGEQAILRQLLEADGQAVDRDAISEATGYKRSSRDAYIQRLQARRLVVTDRGTVRAADALFD
jgi:hypothetical protein